MMGWGEIHHKPSLWKRYKVVKRTVVYCNVCFTMIKNFFPNTMFLAIHHEMHVVTGNNHEAVSYMGIHPATHRRSPQGWYGGLHPWSSSSILDLVKSFINQMHWNTFLYIFMHVFKRFAQFEHNWTVCFFSIYVWNFYQFRDYLILILFNSDI